MADLALAQGYFEVSPDALVVTDQAPAARAGGRGEIPARGELPQRYEPGDRHAVPLSGHYNREISFMYMFLSAGLPMQAGR
jgi:hypothetical protein